MKTFVTILGHTIDVSNIKSIGLVEKPTIDWDRFDDSGETSYHITELNDHFYIELIKGKDIWLTITNSKHFTKESRLKYKTEFNYLRHLRNELVSVWNKHKPNIIHIK